MRPISVLLVDDDPHFTPMFERVLLRRAAREGITLAITTAGSVAEAVRQTERFDLALLDVHLPDGTALHVLEKWRASRRYENLPVRVISADPIDAFAAKCLLLGAPTMGKSPHEPMVDVVIELMREIASAPRTPREEKEQFAAMLADDAKLSPADRDVLVRRTTGASVRETGVARGTSEGTVQRQSKSIARALRAIGVAVKDDLVNAVLHKLIAERYDEAE